MNKQSNHFDAPIFILGLPRSGTSMIAGALGLCGAWTGKTVPGGGEANPKGFFEHTVIREHITKKILIELGYDPLGVRTLPPANLNLKINNLNGMLQRIIEGEGYHHDRPWLYKDAKLTLIWPIFRSAFPKARWLIVRRDLDGFIHSCQRTKFMCQHSTHRAYWENFAEEYTRRLNALVSSGAHVLEVFSPDIIRGDFSALEQTIPQLGLTYQETMLREFISPKFWHNHSKA